MRKLMMAAAIAALAWSGAAAAGQTWTGTISDKMCGADHRKMGGQMSDRDCTLACAKGGSPYVLVAGDKIYQLSGHDADLRTHAGHAVSVAGELKGDTIRVAKIEMAHP